CKFLFEPLDALACLGEFVGDGDCSHHGQPRVADLAEFAAQPIDPVVELAREVHQMAFLAVLAGHSKLAAINGYADLRHFLGTFPGTLSRCYINLATSFEPFCSIVGSSRSSRRNLTRVFLVAELQDAANCFDRLIDSLRDLAIGA